MKRNYKILICLGLASVFLLTGCSGKAKVTLGEYKGIEASYTKKIVTDEDIENALIGVVTAKDENVEITDRPVRNGDIVNIDYVGKMDGKEFENGADTRADLEIGSGSFIDGFEKQVIGMNVGDEKDITVTFPDPYQNNPDFSGKEAVFTVKVNSISGKVIPSEVTDEMIKELDNDYESVGEYREYLKSELEKNAEEINTERKEQAVWAVVLENSKATKLPNKKVKYYSNLFEKSYMSYADSYQVDLNTFVTEYMGSTMDEFNASKKEYGERMTTDIVILEAIADKEDLSISKKKFNSYIKENKISDTDKKQNGESIKDNLLFEKVIKFIINKATITEN